MEQVFVNAPDSPLGLLDESCLTETGHLMARLAVGQRFDRAGAMVQEHLATGGKKLRARLALTAVEALGGTRARGVGWAAAVELLHNASLVHDDIQDGDRVRRGQPTLWAHHGVPQAINAGDLMLMLPYLAIEHASDDPGVRWALCRAMALSAAQTVRGQADEMDLLVGHRFGWKNYLRVVQGKTASLISLPVEGAALVVGFDGSAAQALGAAFGPLGTLFQVQDDVLDLYGDKGRAAPGCDLREGKVSALVVAHLHLHPQDTDWLVELLRAPRDATPDADVALAIDRFRRGGALELVLQQVRQLAAAPGLDPVLLAHPALSAVADQLGHFATRSIRHLLAAR